jgi:hypothetical protein
MTGDFKYIPELCKEHDFTEDTLKNESYELFLRGRTVQRYSSELDTRSRSGRSGVLHLSPLYTSVLCLRTGENFITRMPSCCNHAWYALSQLFLFLHSFINYCHSPQSLFLKKLFRM